MNAVFCSLNSQYIHSSLAPWCLLSGVRRYGTHSVNATVVEGTINEPTEAILRRILAHAPAAVGFSCYIWNITQTRELARRVKAERPDCFVFFGGPEVSYCTEQVLLENPDVDAVVAGEGEYPVSRLLDALALCMPLGAIDGVSYRKGEKLQISPPYLTEEEPPSPYVSEYFDTLNGRIAYLETSRGCPFSCAFCLSGRCGGVRFYPLERVKRELLLLANSGTKTVKLVDRTFNANRQRANEIFQFLINGYGTAFPKGVCFHFEIGGDLLDEDTLVLLSEAPAGLFQMEIGLQSFHEPTLAAVHRKTDTTRLTDNIRKLIVGGNIHTHIDLIAGLPYEDMNTFQNGFNTAWALNPHMLQLGFLKLLHGADMREHPEQYPCRYGTLPPYEVQETPWLSAEELDHLHHIEQALDRLYNSGRFRRTLRYVMERTQKTAFAVFDMVARYCDSHDLSHIPLDAYTELIFTCFAEHVDTKGLRDVMILDRLSANPSALLPPCLRQHPEQAKHLKKLADTDPRYARPAGVRRGAACLSDGKTLAYADHTAQNPVTSAYAVRFFEEACLSRPYTTLLFDLDGTITDPAEGITNSVAYALAKFGIAVEDKRELYRFIGPPLIDSFRDFYGFTDDQARQALGFYREYYAVSGIYENVVYDGMQQLLWDLKRHGYRVLVATSKPELYARRIFDCFNMTDVFDVIAGSDMAERRAKKAQVIAYALDQAGLADPTQAIMIGDRSFDVIGAKTAELPCVGVLFGYGDRDELEQAGAAHIVKTVNELHSLFLEDV